MSELALVDPALVPSMTSLEIAELVDKRHDNVKRTIETLIDRGVIASPQIEEKPTAGRPTTYYLFEGEKGKRDSIVVVAQLSPGFTARLVDRWQELEKKISGEPAFRLPQNYKEAVQDLLIQIERSEQLEAEKVALELDNASLTSEVELIKPRAMVFDAMVKSLENLYTATSVARMVGVSVFRLNKYLDEIGGVYDKTAWKYGRREFVARMIDKKLGKMSITPAGYPSARFTFLGAAWVALRFIKDGMLTLEDIADKELHDHIKEELSKTRKKLK